CVSLLSIKRQSVEDLVPQVIGILIVLKDLLDMDRTLPTRSKRVREGFRGELLVDPHSGHRIVVCRSRICLRKGVDQLSLRRSDREDLPSIVDRDRPNLHSRPSLSRSLIRSRSFRDAAPIIGFLLSKSHFTTSLPFRYTWTC